MYKESLNTEKNESLYNDPINTKNDYIFYQELSDLLILPNLKILPSLCPLLPIQCEYDMNRIFTSNGMRVRNSVRKNHNSKSNYLLRNKIT